MAPAQKQARLYDKDEKPAGAGPGRADESRDSAPPVDGARLCAITPITALAKPGIDHVGRL